MLPIILGRRKKNGKGERKGKIVREPGEVPIKRMSDTKAVRK